MSPEEYIEEISRRLRTDGAGVTTESIGDLTSRLSVRLSASSVEVFDGPKQVASHERAFGRYVEVLTLDHYLEVLKTKPGGLPGATALTNRLKGTTEAPASDRSEQPSLHPGPTTTELDRRTIFAPRRAFAKALGC